MMDIPPKLLKETTPFLVCSEAKVRESVAKLKELGANIHYSVKTNPSEELLGILISEDVGFSLSSPEDLKALNNLGARKEKIIYHERALTLEKLKSLADKCDAFVADNEKSATNAIEFLKPGKTIILRLRANTPKNAYSGDYDAGMSADKLISYAVKAKEKGLTVGILHHSSSQMEDSASWDKKFKELYDVSQDFKFDMIDIGGGFPVPYKGQDYSALLKHIASGLSELNKIAPRVVIEPGRAIAAGACTLVTRVALLDGEDAILDASLYKTHLDSIIAGINLPYRSLKQGSLQDYRLLGSSLCNMDVFAVKAGLPELGEGDFVLFDNAGAYNFSSDFTPGGGVKIFVV